MSKRKLLIGAGYALAAIAILYAFSPEPEPAPVSFEVAPAAEIASRARLERALDKHVKLHFDKTPLDQAIKQISEKVGIPIHIDERSLEDTRRVLGDGSFRVDMPVTLDVSGVSLRSALRPLLSPHDLLWSLHNDAVVIRARDSDCPSSPIVVVYPVRDLVLERSTSGVVSNYQSLIDVIMATVVPWAWDEVGGPASINMDLAAGALVIAQSREYQSQVGLLLTALRKARDAQSIRPGETITADLGQRKMGMGGANPAPAPAKPQSTTPSQSPAAGPANSTAPPNVTGHP